jgi:MFS family permease
VNDFPVTYARRALLASLVSIGMGFTVLFPVLAPAGREMGLSEFQITAIIACSSLTVFLASPIWGRLSDRWGRKRVMLFGLFGFTAGTVLFNSVLHVGLAGVITGWTLFGALVLARMVHAIMMAATMPAANAYMADITDVANRTKGMGAAGAANNLGSMIGPALGGLAVFSLLTPLWVMAAVSLLTGLFVLRFLPDAPRQAGSRSGDRSHGGEGASRSGDRSHGGDASRSGDRSHGDDRSHRDDRSHGDERPHGARLKYSDRRILPFVVVGVLMFMGFALVQQTMGFRFQDTLGLSAGATARIFGFAMMLSAASSLFAQAVIVQRLTVAPFTLLKLALPVLIVAFSVMAVAESRLMLTLGMMIQGFGMGLAGPGFMAGASLAVSPREQGAVAGVAGSCGPLGFTIGPLVGGALYQVNPSLPYVFAACVYILLFASMHWIGRRVLPQAPAAMQEQPAKAPTPAESPSGE